MQRANTYDDQYGTCNETYVTLRVLGGTDNPSSVSARLGIEPTSMRVLGKPGVWRKGEWRIPPGNSPESQNNSWSLSTQGVVISQDSLRHVDHLLDLLESQEDTVKELFHEGWKVEMIVYWDSKWGHGGPMLTPQTIHRLSHYGIGIWYDVYFSDRDRPSEEVQGHPGVFRVGT